MYYMVFLICIISMTALMGWVVDHDLLARWIPAIANMTVNTALCFLFLAASASLSNKCMVLRKAEPMRNRGAGLCALLVLIFALLSLTQDLFGTDLWIDNYIFDATVYQLASVHPGRMSDLTSLAFILSSTAMILFTLDFRKKSAVALMHGLFILVALIALLGLAMNLLIGRSPDELGHTASISTLTSITFMLLVVFYIKLLKKCHQLEGYSILYSGIYMMLRLKYPQKFALISIIFSLPLFVLVSHELQGLHKQSELVKYKVMAASLAHPVVNLINEVAAHRGMMNTQLVEGGMFDHELERSKAKVALLMADSKQLGESYQLASNDFIDWPKLEEHWRVIDQPSTSPADVWKLHTEIILMLHDYLRSTGRETEIFYDSNHVLHNLAEIQLNLYPKLSENIAQLRGLGTKIVFQNTSGEPQKLMLSSILSQLKLQLSEYQRLIETIEFELKSEQYKWQVFNQSFIKRTELLINLVQSELLNKSSPSYNAEQYFKYVSGVLQLGSSLSHYTLEQTSSLLEQQANQLLLKQYLIKLSIILMVLVIAYLFLAFYQSVRRSIRVFGSAVESMSHGQEYELDLLSAHDELLTSFNRLSNKLLKMNVKLSAVVNHAADAIITFDANGMIQSFNPAAEKLFSASESELCGKHILEFIPNCPYNTTNQDLKGVLNFSDSEVICTSFETIALTKKQLEFPINLSMSGVCVDAERFFIAMVTDLTVQKKLQAELEKAQRAQSIAGLVKGVAHNFNNMLAGIVGQTYLAKASQGGQGEFIHHLDQVEAISEKAADMVKQLLTFSKNDFFRVQSDHSLVDLIEESFLMFKLGLTDHIDLSIDIEPADMMIHCDRSQIQQVFVNIMENARDALEGVAEKRIEVRLHQFEASSEFLHKHPRLEKGLFACLEIIDSGHGMSQDTMGKIFDPFFTLKDVDQGIGLGLGLSAVYGSIGSHKGAIEVDSKLDSYSHFKVYLPLLESGQPAFKIIDKAEVIKGHGETLLLVDDELLVLNTTKAVLQSLGYQVLIAHDGVEGLQCFKNHMSEIDAIVSDLVMPKMGGVEMCREIHSLNNDMHGILMTGYDMDEVKLKSGEERWLTRISKPASILEISQAVHRVLANKS